MIGPTDLLHPSPAPHFKTFQAFLICCPERPSFSTIQSHACTTLHGALCVTCLVRSTRTRGSEEASLLLGFPFTWADYIRFTVGVTWRATVIFRRDPIISNKLKEKFKGYLLPTEHTAKVESQVAYWAVERYIKGSYHNSTTGNVCIT